MNCYVHELVDRLRQPYGYFGRGLRNEAANTLEGLSQMLDEERKTTARLLAEMNKSPIVAENYGGCIGWVWRLLGRPA